MFSHQGAEIERKSSVRSLADEQGVAADIIAELDCGESVVVLLSGSSRSERSSLLDCLCARLASNNARVIRIGGSEGGPVDVHRLCHLLLAASSADAIVSDPAERLASILTVHRAGERSLMLIVEDADALSPDALAFVARLAAASSAQPLRMQVLLVGSHARQLRLAGLGPVAVKRLDGLPARSLNPLSMQQRARRLRLALAAAGCLAGVAVIGMLRPIDNDRLSAKAGSAIEAPPGPARPSVAFALEGVSSTMAPPESALSLAATIVSRSVPSHSKESPPPTAPQVQSPALMAPKGGASRQADVVPGAGKAVLGHAPEPQIATTNSSAEPLRRPAFDVSLTRVGELLSRRPTSGAAPPDTQPPAIAVAHTEPPPEPVQPEETHLTSTAATAASDARPAAEPSAVPITHTEPLATPAQPSEKAVPSTTAATAGAAQSATKPQRPPPGASPAAVAALLTRGNALIAIGNVSAARLLYQRAAMLDSARAATAIGKTYDPRFLQVAGAIGVVAGPDAAVAWYRKGAALGDKDAAPLLGGLDVRENQ